MTERTIDLLWTITHATAEIEADSRTSYCACAECPTCIIRAALHELDPDWWMHPTELRERVQLARRD